MAGHGADFSTKQGNGLRLTQLFTTNNNHQNDGYRNFDILDHETEPEAGAA